MKQASALQVAPDQFTVDHVVDLAEIPTFQTKPEIDRNHDDALSGAERGASGEHRECVRVAGNLTVEVDSTRTR